MRALRRPGHGPVLLGVLAAVLVLAGLSVGPWLEKVGREAAAELSRRTGARIDISRFGWRFPFSVVLRDVRVSYGEGMRLEAARLEIGFAPSLGWLVRPSAVSDHLRSVMVVGLRLDVDERTLRMGQEIFGGWVERSGRGRLAKILFLDNAVRYRWNGGEVTASGLSGLLVPLEGGGWRLNMRSDVSVGVAGQKAEFLWVCGATSGREGGWPESVHEWKRLVWNGQPLDAVRWETVGTRSSWTLRAYTDGKRLDGVAVVTQGRLAASELVVRGFPFGRRPAWVWDGTLRWDGAWHGSLRGRAGEEQFSVSMTNGLPLALVYAGRDGGEAVLGRDGRGRLRLPLVRAEAGLKWTASPAGMSVSVGPFRKDGEELGRPFRVRIRREGGGVVMSSPEKAFEGVVNLSRLGTAYLVVDAGVLQPRLGGWVLRSGKLRWSVAGWRAERWVLADRSGRTVLEAAGRYVAASNALAMRLEGDAVKVHGVWSRRGRSDVWGFQGHGSAGRWSGPLGGEAKLSSGAATIRMSSSSLGRAVLELREAGPFRLKAELDGKTPDRRMSWRGSALLSGTGPDVAGWTGQANVEVYGWSYGPFRVPYSSWEVMLKPGVALRWAVLLAADPMRKTVWSMEGMAEGRPWSRVEVKGSGGLLWRYVRTAEGREWVFRSGEQDLSLLNAFLRDGSRRFGGRFSCQWEAVGRRPPVMTCSASNLRWDGWTVNSARFVGRAQGDATRLQGTVRTGDGGEIRLVEGLFRPTEAGAKFASVWRISGGLVNTDMELSGVLTEDLGQARLDLRSVRWGERSLPRRVQFVRWNRRTGRVDVVAQGEGFYAELVPGTSGRWSFQGGWGGAERSLWAFRGTLGPSGWLEVSMEASEMPMDFLMFVLPLRSVAGTLGGEVVLKGPVARPAWEKGFLQVKGGRFRSGDEWGNLEARDMALTVRVADDTMVVEEGTMRLSGGRAKVDGRVEWSGYTVADYAFSVSFLTNEWGFVKFYNDIQGLVNGQVVLERGDGRPAVRGRVFLRKADVTFPFQGAVGVRRRTDRNEDIDLDLEVVALEGVQYFQPLNNIQLEVQPGSRLRLRGRFGWRRPTGEERVQGRVDVRRGRMEYLGTAFQVRRAQLVFAEEHGKPVPKVSLEAETRVPTDRGEVRVTLLGDGWLDESYEVRLVSTPALTRREILSVLGFGRLYDRVVVRDGAGDRTVDLTDPTDEELNALLVAGVLTYLRSASEAALIRPLERRLLRMTGLDKLEMRPTLSEDILRRGLALPAPQGRWPWRPVWENLAGGQFTVGKYLTDFLFLEYMMSLERPEPLAADSAETMPMLRDRHQIRMEVNLKALSLEWRYRPSFLSSDRLLWGEDTQEWELRWQKSF